MRKTRMAWVLLVVLLAGCTGSGTVTLGGGTVSAQGGMNNAALQGAYGYTFSGFESPGRHIVAVGRLVFDGNGNITSGTQRRTEEGGFEFQFPITGTYAVNTDGTGRITMRFDSSVDTWSIVVVGGGQRVRMVSIEPNNFFLGALSGELERQ